MTLKSMCWALLLDFPCCPFRFLKDQHLVRFLVNSVTINIMQSVCGRRRRRQLIKGFKQDGELIEWILVMVESLMCFRAFEEQCGCERKRKLINQTWTTTKLIWSKKKKDSKPFVWKGSSTREKSIFSLKIALLI